MVGCHRCGGRSKAGARYCGACGTVLGSARSGVRKTVTVLFADAPSLTGGHDLESRVRLAAAFYEAVRDVIVAHGGTVERDAGDAVMAVFGIPASRDDDARRAAAAALALLEATLPGGATLAIGINTGEVLAGTPDGEEELAVGDPVVVAARLQGQAAPNEILLGPATAALLGAAARLGPGRRVSLKGRADELIVSPLLGLDGAIDRGQRGPLFGRDGEVELLLAAFDRTLDGSVPALITLLGEAGTGKSRLVEEVVARRSVTVLTGVCRAYGAGSAWAPLVEIAEQFVGVPAGGSSAAVLQASVDAGNAVSGLPVLRAVLGADETAVSQPEMVIAVKRLLVSVTAERALVVVIEDLHLAEPALLDLILDVLRDLGDVPLLTLCTARPDLLDLRPDWGRGMAHVLGLTLRPLSEEPARRLAQHLLGGDQAGVEKVLGPAGGNPLFLEQLAQAHLEGTGSPALSVAAVLGARLDRLPLETRQVLERAAVIGPAGRVADLLPLCSGAVLDLDAELATLVRRDLLEVADGRFRFSSELVREAAAAGLMRDDRAHLHQVRGLVLAAQGANAAAGFHFEQAGLLLRQSDPAKSAAMGKQAAARLAAAGLRALTGDLVAAVDLLGRAAALMPRDEPRRLGLLPELARARMLSGDLAGASRALEEAVERAAAVGNAELAAFGRLAQLDLLCATHPERAFTELPAVLSAALPVLTEAHDDRGLALGYQLQAAELQYRVRWAAMELPLERSLHHGRRSGDRRLIEVAEGLLVSSRYYGPMHLDESRQRLELLREQPGNSPAHRASIEARLAATLALQGDPATARSALAQVRRLNRDLGRELSALSVAVLAGPVELLAGEPAQAVGTLREACDGLLALGDLRRLALLGAWLAEACWRCGDLDGAAAAVELSKAHAGPGDVMSQARWRSARAKLLAGAGRSGEALGLSAEAVRLVQTTDELTSQGDLLADAAEVHELLGSATTAQVLLRDAVLRYQRKGATQAAARLAPRLVVQASPPLVELDLTRQPAPR